MTALPPRGPPPRPAEPWESPPSYSSSPLPSLQLWKWIPPQEQSAALSPPPLSLICSVTLGSLLHISGPSCLSPESTILFLHREKRGEGHGAMEVEPLVAGFPLQDSGLRMKSPLQKGHPGPPPLSSSSVLGPTGYCLEHRGCPKNVYTRKGWLALPRGRAVTCRAWGSQSSPRP